MERSRTYGWEDPLPAADRAREMPGLEYLQAVASGELPPPPIGMTLGFEFASMSEGRAEFTVTPGEHHYNPIGTVHGGLVLTLIDSAASCAVHTTLPAGVGYTTLDLTTNFVRPITKDTGTITAVGTVIHAGRSIAIGEARVVDDGGKLYAHGTATCMILR